MQIITGKVQAGAKRGRTLGCPTANLPLADISFSGVYAGVVYLGSNMSDTPHKSYKAAVFADPSRQIIEAHLLDFQGDLYGREITIKLQQKIRDSRQFTNDEELKLAIAEDIEKIKRSFTD